eukprot:GHVU01010421.1.p1 GENE.GHVU01010421.1~~GHVU01010421.1.p1  ORF type:complete len:352 (+),score=82.23 GHVU01010421.1:368-1423(+)
MQSAHIHNGQRPTRRRRFRGFPIESNGASIAQLVVKSNGQLAVVPVSAASDSAPPGEKGKATIKDGASDRHQDASPPPKHEPAQSTESLSDQRSPDSGAKSDGVKTSDVVMAEIKLQSEILHELKNMRDSQVEKDRMRFAEHVFDIRQHASPAIGVPAGSYAADSPPLAMAQVGSQLKSSDNTGATLALAFGVSFGGTAVIILIVMLARGLFVKNKRKNESFAEAERQRQMQQQQQQWQDVGQDQQQERQWEDVDKGRAEEGAFVDEEAESERGRKKKKKKDKEKKKKRRDVSDEEAYEKPKKEKHEKRSRRMSQDSGSEEETIKIEKRDDEPLPFSKKKKKPVARIKLKK